MDAAKLAQRQMPPPAHTLMPVHSRRRRRRRAGGLMDGDVTTVTNEAFLSA